MNVSFGSYIDTIAQDQVVLDRESRYFITCGLNGIIDSSDNSIGSQMSIFSFEAKGDI